MMLLPTLNLATARAKDEASSSGVPCTVSAWGSWWRVAHETETILELKPDSEIRRPFLLIFPTGEIQERKVKPKKRFK